ncbi:hypothetical protein Bbelb_133400 [Branchiostoma belcheri]|nr:hypothetical protein Bbelb_133400 [Branchiostoma belcheri]
MAEYIQMHHIENNWLCLVHKRERLESRCMTVLYTTVAMNLRRQLVSLYNHHASVDEGVLPVTVIRAQRQAGSSDCGVFAVASAFALAEGKCPTGICALAGVYVGVFEPDKLRPTYEGVAAARTGVHASPTTKYQMPAQKRTRNSNAFKYQSYQPRKNDSDKTTDKGNISNAEP